MPLSPYQQQLAMLFPDQNPGLAAANALGHQASDAALQAAADAAGQSVPMTQTSGPKGPAVSARQGYLMAGGLGGTKMSFDAFKRWWMDSTAQAGMDPVSYARMAGLGYGGIVGKPAVAPQKGQAVRAGAGANVLQPGSNLREFYNPATLSDAGQLAIINSSAGRSYKSLQEAKDAMGLGFQVAGAGQWVANQGGQGGIVRSTPALQNVSMVGLSDPSAMGLFLGGLGSLNARGQGKQAAQIAAQRDALVPDWLREVQKGLQAAGVPYVPIELIADPSMLKVGVEKGAPSVEFPDPSRPLYGPSDRPPSLFNLTGFQAGESNFYRSLSPAELLRDVGEQYAKFYNRPAGSPVPAGMEGGPFFGSPVSDEQGNYTRSFIQGPQQLPSGTYASMSDVPGMSGAPALYNRFSAYGMPGDYTQLGSPEQGMLAGGASTPDFSGVRNPFPPGSPQWRVFEEAKRRWGENYWSANPRIAPYENLDPATLARLMALQASPVTPSAFL